MLQRPTLALLCAAACAVVVAAPASAVRTSDFTARGSVLVATSPGYPLFGAPGMCDAASPFQGVTGYAVSLPAGAPSHHYALTSGGGLADHDVAFLGATCAVLAVHARRDAPEAGTVPAGTRWAYVVLSRGVAGEFLLTVRGVR